MNWTERISEDVRPWGRFRRYTLNEVSTVKIITILPGQSLSEQRHERRDELWVVLDDGIEVQVGDTTTRPESGDEFFVPRGETHRLSCAGDHPARVLEVAFGEFDESDIERISDVYGRVQ